MDWRQQGKIWQLTPAQPIGQVDFIGGSYLAATPQVSYRRLLEDLSNNGLVINAWAYVPGFDHQSQARRPGRTFVAPGSSSKSVMACCRRPSRRGQPRLQIAAAGSGWRRNCRGHGSPRASTISQADRSIPLLGEIAPRLGVETEFSPSPSETLHLITGTL